MVSTRYDLQGNITRFLGDGNDEFQASNTVDTIVAIAGPAIITEPFPFNDDSTFPNFDTNGNYDPVLFRYTIPLTGVYTFQVIMDYRWDVLLAVQGTVQIRLKRFDVGDVLLETVVLPGESFPTPNPAPNTPYTIDRIFNINGLATDYITVSMLGLTSFPTGVSSLRYLAGSTYGAI